MGVDAGDFDNDGDEDLFMTQLPTEGGSLYVNDGSGLFEDRSSASGLGPSQPWVTPASAPRGSTSTMTAGSICSRRTASIEAQAVAAQREISATTSAICCSAISGTGGSKTSARRPVRSSDQSACRPRRGLRRYRQRRRHRRRRQQHASAGRTADQHDRQPPSLDRCAPARVRCAPATAATCGASRDMIGARVQIVRQSGPALWRRARADGSYASANDPRVVVGLGDSTEPPTFRVFVAGRLGRRIPAGGDRSLDRSRAGQGARSMIVRPLRLAGAAVLLAGCALLAGALPFVREDVRCARFLRGAESAGRTRIAARHAA